MSSTSNWHHERKIDKSINKNSSPKKYFQHRLKKLVRRIIDEINDRFMKFDRINIIAFRIQTVKNSFAVFFADFFVRIQSFSIFISIFRDQTRFENYSISFFFSLFSTIFAIFHFKWSFVCFENFFHGSAFSLISDFIKNVVFAETISNSKISNPGFFNSRTQVFKTVSNLAVSDLVQKIPRKYSTNNLINQCSDFRIF